MSADDEPPIHKLVYAVLLSAIKKQVRFVTVVPDVVWFGTDAGWKLEMRPPLRLHSMIADRFAEMLGVEAPSDRGEWVAGPLVLQLANLREPFAVHIERLLEGWWILVERLNNIEHAKRVRSGVLVQPAVPPIPIPGHRMEGDHVAFDPAPRQPSEFDAMIGELEDVNE